MRGLLASALIILSLGCNRYHLVRPLDVAESDQYCLKDPELLSEILAFLPMNGPLSVDLTDTAFGALRWRMDSLAIHRVEVRGLGSFDLDQSTFSDRPPYAVVLHHFAQRRRQKDESVVLFQGPLPPPEPVLTYLRQQGYRMIDDTTFARVGSKRSLRPRTDGMQ